MVGLVDDGLCIDRGAEIESARWYPADHTRFGGHRHQIRDFFLIGDIRYAFGHADTEVDDAVGLEFERCAPRNDFAFGQFHGRNCSRACPDFTAERGVILDRECLPMVFRLCEDHTVDKNAGYLDLSRVKRAAVSYSFDLGDNQTTRVARGHRDRQHFECKRLLFHRNVAVGVGGGAANDADINREGAIEKKFLAVDLKNTDEIVFCALIDLAAAVARVNERSESDAREMPWALRGNVAKQMRNDALRKVIGFYPVGDSEALQFGYQAPVPADHASHQSFMAKMVEPTLFAVALASGIDQREIARLAGRFESPRLSTNRAPPVPPQFPRRNQCPRNHLSRPCHRRERGGPPLRRW